MKKEENHPSSLRWLWTVPGKKKYYVLFLTVLEALSSASGVLYALGLKAVVDGAVKQDRSAFIRGAVFLLALTAGQLLLRALVRYYHEKAMAEMENLFKTRLFSCLLRKDYAAVMAFHSGEWMNRLTEDTRIVSDSYVTVFPGLIGMLVKLISAFVLMIALDSRFTLILLPAGMFIGLIAGLLRGRIKALHKNTREKDGTLRSFLQERMGSMLLLRAFSAQEQVEEAAAEHMEAHKTARMRRMRFSALANLGFGIVVQGMYVFAVIWFGYGILEGRISYGTLTAMTQLITQIQAPFANFSVYLPRWYAMLASAERLMEAEAFEEDLPSPRPLEEENRYYEQSFERLLVRDVYFSYPDSEKQGGNDAVKGASWHVNKGEILAFTGQSGCGKSTLLKLLLCVYHPRAGEILLQGSGEEKLLTAAHRRLFAYVPQGNLLLEGSVREAISFGDPERAGEDARIWEALEVACAAEFVREQEKGLDTLLGERGAGFSEGQLQRLAIARAIFAGNPILLLDEATASLDGETEARFLENVRALKDKTVLIVTHRPAALAICDRQLHFSEEGIF